MFSTPLGGGTCAFRTWVVQNPHEGQGKASEPNELSTKPFELDDGDEGRNDVSKNGAGAGGDGLLGGSGDSTRTPGSGYGVPTSLKVEPFDS